MCSFPPNFHSFLTCKGFSTAGKHHHADVGVFLESIHDRVELGHELIAQCIESYKSSGGGTKGRLLSRRARKEERQRKKNWKKNWKEKEGEEEEEKANKDTVRCKMPSSQEQGKGGQWREVEGGS